MKMGNEASFSDLSLQCARDFLHSVVVVDDRATLGAEKEGAIEARTGEGDERVALVEPDEFDSAADEGSRSAVAVRADKHGLNARILTKKFAAEGLVCAVLKPSPEDDLSSETALLARQADILVVDWELSDNGDRALNLIETVLIGDEAAGGRLRLIAIYTGSTLYDVNKKVSERVPTLKPTASGKIWDLSLECGSCKIIFLGKGVEDLQHKNQYVLVDELPSRLIGEFAKFSGGILANTTLATIAEIRKNTHRILGRFNRTLDGAILTHRTLCPTANDAESYMTDLILQEIEANVPLHRITKKYGGSESVKSFLRYKVGPFSVMRDGDGKEKIELDVASVSDFIEADSDGHAKILTKLGLSQDEVTKIMSNIHKRLYLLTETDLAYSRDKHERFAIISSIKRSTSDVDPKDKDALPVMRLGSIVKMDGRYYVCLTPLCDSVRIPSDGVTFIFGELKKDSGKFNVIVPEGGGRTKLRLDKKHMHIESLIFRPAPGADVIQAREKELDGAKSIVFEYVEGPGTKNAIWIADLKPMQAQRIAHSIAAHLSRIGLDEFEWQRRNSPPN